jgi:hypothetical protein
MPSNNESVNRRGDDPKHPLQNALMERSQVPAAREGRRQDRSAIVASVWRRTQDKTTRLQAR